MIKYKLNKVTTTTGIPGAQLGGDLGEIIALGAKISP